MLENTINNDNEKINTTCKNINEFHLHNIEGKNSDLKKNYVQYSSIYIKSRQNQSILLKSRIMVILQ